MDRTESQEDGREGPVDGEEQDTTENRYDGHDRLGEGRISVEESLVVLSIPVDSRREDIRQKDSEQRGAISASIGAADAAPGLGSLAG